MTNLFRGSFPLLPGVGVLKAEEGLSIMQATEVTSQQLRPMCSLHIGSPVFSEQGVHKSGLLSPPALTFVQRNCCELLLKPAPIDSPIDLIAARVDQGSSGLYSSRAHGPPPDPFLS
jgi:hypothetical protein